MDPSSAAFPVAFPRDANFGRSGGAPARLFVRADVSKAFNSWRIRIFQSTMAPNRDIKNGMPGIDWPSASEK
jgi:hypothetical protein